ncbi:MAG: carboxymuconolactone decarboxylase family protein [Armatimonadetes bacterium]|nr:carboxymuconolactone decarboxylase family protein [Armatimonadota bacterium]
MSQTPKKPDKLPGFFVEFSKKYPEVARAYNQLGDATSNAGPLDEHSIRLIKLGIALGARSEGAVHSHARRALAAGASPEELEHVALLAITTLGFPQAMAGLSWITDVTRREPHGPDPDQPADSSD